MTWAVLIPCPIGYCLFVRWPGQRLRSCAEIVAPADLSATVGALGERLGVVLVGRRGADFVSDAVLRVAELVIVPDAWLRRIPKRALSARAETAVRIAAAHHTAPVEHRLPYEREEPIPF